jgi:hypothetical protein
MKWFINSLFYFAPWFIPVNEHLYYFRLGEESRMLARLQFGLYRDELRTLNRREHRAPCFIGNPCASVSIPPSLASARPAVVKFPRVKLFYTGPVVNTEMLIVMLEKHGIIGTQEFVDPSLPDDGDLNRLAKVFVPEADYDRAHQLFYAEREDEL